ncbi:hypothetical protein [Lysobacter soyae]|uniref:Uncharacterized protein n=1 Tax=Lysobacter soyae TaxID=2764185 RepID=A0ABX8WLX8_9GAMM|nr:hypothetical protein [Lysobacter sp. CJ11]QYR52394.1 hypothetical protein H8L67_07250 [Lysobacter sp. CJ11]
MKLLIASFAAALAATALPAAASDKITYGWCEVEIPAGTYQMSALLQAPSGPSDAMERLIAADMGADRSGSCWVFYASPSEAESYLKQRQYVITTHENKRFNQTKWTGPYSIKGAPPKATPGAHLTVEPVEKPVPRATGGEVLGDLEKLRAANKRKTDGVKAAPMKRGRAQ